MAGFPGTARRAVPCNSASLRLLDTHSPRVFHSYAYGYNDDEIRRYHNKIVHHDPFREYLNQIGIGVRQSREVISDRDYERTEHYQQLFRPRGNFYAAGGHVYRHDGRAWQIGVHRGRRHGPFERAEMERLAYFAHHLGRAARLMERLDASRRALALAHGALDEVSFGIWLLDRQGRCQWMNGVADGISRDRGSGVRLHAGRLTHARPETARAMQHAVTNALDEPPRSGRVALDGEGRGLLVTPVASSLPTIAEPAGGALVICLDPQQERDLDPAALRDLYGLTPAEARLAQAVATGATLESIGEAFGVSHNTIRTQLRALMRKTDTNRQAELIRTLLLGPGLHP